MNYEILAYLSPYLFAGVVAFLIAAYAWHSGRTGGAALFALISLADGIRMVGVVMEAFSGALRAKLIWENIQVATMVPIPALLYLLVLSYTGHSSRHRKAVLGVYGCFAFTMLALVLTDPWLGLAYRDIAIPAGNPHSQLTYSFTPVFRLATISTFILTIYSIGRLISHVFRVHAFFRAQGALVLVGFLGPTIATVFVVQGISPELHRLLVPATSVFRHLLVSWALFHFALFEIVPLARRTLVDNMEHWVLLFDDRSILVDYNRSALQALGLAEQGLMGQPASQVLSRFPDLLSLHGDTRREHMILPCARGDDLRYFDVTRQVLSDRSGRLLGVSLTGHDITESRRAEARLEAEKQLWERTFDSVSDLIMILDPDYTIIKANRATGRACNCPPAELVGRRCYEVLHAATAPPPHCRHGKLFESGREQKWECMSESLNRQLAVSIAPLQDEAGSIIGAVHQARDITRQRENEMRLEQAMHDAEEARKMAEAANRSKSTFLANMSHELRTPLNAILGFSQLIARDRELKKLQRKNLDLITRSGEHLLAMINDILDISRIEMGKMEVKPSVLDLGNLLVVINETMCIRAARKNIRFEMERSEDLPRHIRTDESKLRQILLNLVGNAVKYTDHGSIRLQVRKSLEEAGDNAMSDRKPALSFTIEDTGVGIPPDDLDHIFDPFIQGPDSIHREGGTGLGLAICKHIVEAHGGRIWAESSAVVEGGLFRFTLALAGATEITDTTA